MTRTRTEIATPDMMTGTSHGDTLTMDLGDNDRSITLEPEQTLEELRDSLNTPVSRDMNDPAFKKYADETDFMDEKVVVLVHESPEKNAEKIVDVYNNGTPQRFVRGEWVICRRKFVEVLARAKPFGVTTPEIVDGNGDRATKISMASGHRYSFEMRDRNPLGQAWLNNIMRQP
jgi:hypothetical protein